MSSSFSGFVGQIWIYFPPSVTAADFSRLAEWFDRFDARYWNGECYALEDGKTLWPIDREIAPDEWGCVGWEIR